MRISELTKGIQRLNHNISSELMLKYIDFTRKLGSIESNYIWHVIKQPTRLDYEEFNTNGHLVYKEEVDICEESIKSLPLNIKPSTVKGSSISLLFLPDFILCELSDERFVIEYGELNLASKESNIVEDTLNPRDSETLEMTKNHPGKGSKLVPIKRYGELILQQNHRKITLLTSNSKAVKAMEEVLNEYIAFYDS